MYKREKEFTKYLHKNGKSWIYQPERFKLEKTTYRADFYCPENDTYYEVAGSRQAFHLIKPKLIEFIKTYPKIKFKIVRPNGREYASKESLLKEGKSKPKKKFLFYMSEEMKNDLLQIAKERYLSIAEIIRIAIKEKIKNEGEK